MDGSAQQLCYIKARFDELLIEDGIIGIRTAEPDESKTVFAQWSQGQHANIYSRKRTLRLMEGISEFKRQSINTRSESTECRSPKASESGVPSAYMQPPQKYQTLQNSVTTFLYTSSI